MRDPGSFRDPSGYIFSSGDRIFRAINEEAYRNFLLLKSSGAYDDLIGRGWIIAAQDVSTDQAAANVIHRRRGESRLLEHPKLPFISYPYEWPFALLKRAALLHLDIHLRALDFDLTLSDASAYNIQFIGIRPLFIDIPSFVPYRNGDYWNGHRQFVEQFVNPLLLRALFGISHNAWYRGALDGIPTGDIVALIGWPKRWFARDLLINITLPDLLQRRSRWTSDGPSREAKPLPKAALQMVLRRLRRWIGGLAPKERRADRVAAIREREHIVFGQRGEQEAGLHRPLLASSCSVPCVGCRLQHRSLFAIAAPEPDTVGRRSRFRSQCAGVRRHTCDRRQPALPAPVLRRGESQPRPGLGGDRAIGVRGPKRC
jgi:hypothetical protein